MNFLAHIYLSGNNDLLKVGNFMADSIKGKKYLQYPEEIQKGIILHRAIDHYTDTHPVVSSSTARLFGTYGHYNGIIVDIFYDHFLAINWKEYSEVPLLTYTLKFYGLLKKHYEILPKNVKNFMPYMVEGNWLYSYSEVEGIDQVLNGMNRRTENKSGMNKAGIELRKYYAEFQEDFNLFFPDLIEFSKKKISELNS